MGVGGVGGGGGGGGGKGNSPHPPRFPKEHLFLEGSQVLSISSSGRTNKYGALVEN